MSEILSQLPRRDLESLSAYVDGELSPRQRAQLQARLAREPRLKRALAELEATVSLMRDLPQLTPRRSFSLTPDMVGVTAPRPVFPWLQLATVLSAFAFAVTLGFDVLLSRGALGPMAAAPLPAVQELAELDRADVETAEEESLAAGAEAPAAAEVGEALEIAGTPVVEAEGEAEYAAESEAAADAGAAEPAPPAEAPMNELRSQATAPPPATATRSAELSDDLAPGDGAAVTSYQSPPSGRPGLRAVEIGLGVLVLGLVVINWRRRS
jgi:hypothetical protein